jgi:hypothetical protein
MSTGQLHYAGMSCMMSTCVAPRLHTCAVTAYLHARYHGRLFDPFGTCVRSAPLEGRHIFRKTHTRALDYTCTPQISGSPLFHAHRMRVAFQYIGFGHFQTRSLGCLGTGQVAVSRACVCMCWIACVVDGRVTANEGPGPCTFKDAAAPSFPPNLLFVLLVGAGTRLFPHRHGHAHNTGNVSVACEGAAFHAS